MVDIPEYTFKNMGDEVVEGEEMKLFLGWLEN